MAAYDGGRAHCRCPLAPAFSSACHRSSSIAGTRYRHHSLTRAAHAPGGYRFAAARFTATSTYRLFMAFFVVRAGGAYVLDGVS